LSIANSAYFNMRHQINSINRAVVILGVDEVRSICLGTVLMAFMHSGRLRDTEGALKSLAAFFGGAEASRRIAEKLSGISQATALTAGLLHDLGWVVILAFFPEKWGAIKTGGQP
jgi:HD-like signal output (HDOD) protein